MTGVIAFAQEKGRKHPHHRDVVGEMKRELSLSDDQVQRIRSIDESYRGKFHDLRIDSVTSKEEKMKRMRSLGETKKKEVESVLTPEQKAAWETRIAARREQHRARAQQVKEERAARMKSELSLTDKQFEKLQNAQREFKDKASKLRDKRLSEESRKAEFRELRQEHEKKVKSILNKDQYQKWIEMKKKPHGEYKKRKNG